MRQTPERFLMAAAALLLAVATGLGAYASHGLSAALDANALDTFKTAINYQFFHSLGLIGICAICERRRQQQQLLAAGALIAAGIVFFCGGVYASSLDGPGWISSLAPAGGIGLIAGWLLVAYAIIAKPADG